MAWIPCTCICHTHPSVRHVAPCCKNGMVEVSDEDPRVGAKREVRYYTGPEGEKLKDEYIRREWEKRNFNEDLERFFPG